MGLQEEECWLCTRSVKPLRITNTLISLSHTHTHIHNHLQRLQLRLTLINWISCCRHAGTNENVPLCKHLHELFLQMDTHTHTHTHRANHSNEAVFIFEMQQYKACFYFQSNHTDTSRMTQVVFFTDTQIRLFKLNNEPMLLSPIPLADRSRL